VDVSLDICYEPSNLGAVRDTLILRSRGRAVLYQVALVGMCRKPKRKGPFEVKAGKLGTSIEFRNVLGEKAEYRFSINNPVFSLGSTSAKISSKSSNMIKIFYNPPKSSDGDVGNLVITGKNLKHPWIYYIKGIK